MAHDAVDHRGATIVPEHGAHLAQGRLEVRISGVCS